MAMKVDSSVSDKGKSLEGEMRDGSDVKRLELISFPVLPSDGRKDNHNSKQAAKQLDSEQSNERKKKTRRGKPKRKKPYNKESSESRAKNYQKSGARFRNRQQPVAPNNTNQFLMEDHTDLHELDERLQATANRSVEQHPNSVAIHQQRHARARDSSFTSQESDEDYFYSSPEDEEEFLTKEFSNTYQDFHLESLTSMSKTELIQQVLQLEERIDSLEKRMGTINQADQIRVKSTPDVSQGDDGKEDRTVDDYEKEIEKLKVINEQLTVENQRLQRENRSSSVSSVDSESDSSTTSDSSGSSASPDAKRNSAPQSAAAQQITSYMVLQ